MATAAVATSETDRLPAQGESVRTSRGEYALGEVLGDGGYGTVFACVQGGRSLAVKAEKYSKSMLFVEASVLKTATAHGKKHFCRMIDGGTLGKEYVFIVMTLLHKDLHRLRSEQPNRRFSLSTGVRVAMQALQAIRELHEMHFISRDIKPGNFAPGHRLNMEHKTIFMFDFGLARKYMDKFGNKYANRGEVGWRGTTRYGSLVAHERKDLSRRDDMESWFYLLVEVTKGCLPWRLVTDRTQVQVAKLRVRREDRRPFLHGCPDCYDMILSDIDSLLFDSVPNYQFYYGLLERVCTERGIRMNEHWDWDEETTTSIRDNSDGAIPRSQDCKAEQD